MTQDKEILPLAAVTELSISDETDPRSIVNLVPPKVAELLKEHLFTNPEMFDKDEQSLYKYLHKDNKMPSALDNRVRLKFWVEYDRVQERGEKAMNMVNVIAGLCSRELFYNKYLRTPSKMAWLLCPPTGYMAKAEEALEFGLEQLRDLLGRDHVLPNGTVDAKLANIKIKIVAMLDTRVKGAVLQKTMNLSLHASTKDVVNQATAATMEDLQEQLKQLEARNRVAQNLPLPPVAGKPDIEIS